MTSISVNLPANGAPVDVSTMGRERTITVQGLRTGTLNIQFSNKDANGPWATACTFYASPVGKKTIDLAAKFMRVVTAGGTIPNVDVASNNDGGIFAELPVPAGNGAGAAVDVEAFGSFNTVSCLEPFSGTIMVEISEDGIDWAECFTFNQPTWQNKTFVAKLMRVRRKNVPTSGFIGIPVVTVGSILAGASMDTDELVKVNAGDTTAGYLEDKLISSPSIDVDVFDDGSGDLALFLTALTAVPITVRGPTNAEGDSDELARANHQHRLEYEVEDEGVLVSARPRMDFVGAGVGAVDVPGEDLTRVTIPGGDIGDGAVVMRESYSALTVQTSSAVFVDSLLAIPVPIDGNYWAIFEGENVNQSSTSSIEIAIAVGGPAPAGVIVQTQRENNGPAADKRPVITTGPLGALLTGQIVRVYFRKSQGGGPQTVALLRRRLTIFKVQ